MSESELLRIGAFSARALANGPGARATTWVQGCTRGCDGCFNPQFSDPDGGAVVSVAELAKEICATDGIEGVTFSGGEPFLQAPALAKLACAIRRERDFGVLCFTGFTLDELQASGLTGAQDLLAQIDILVDGAFVLAQAGSHLWRGSDNQRILFLTDRYEYLRSTVEALPSDIAVEVLGDRVVTTGDKSHAPMADVTHLLSDLYGIEL